MDVIRDVLDKQLLDSDGTKMGRVDGLVMQFGERTQPRITHIEIGGPTLAARISHRLPKFTRRLAKVWGPKRLAPVRIPWSNVERLGRDVKLNVRGRETGAMAWENWLAKHVIDKLPGSDTK